MNIRPYCIEVLQRLKEHAELIVFTASHQSYADHIIDQIDPNNTLFVKRLYRKNCVKVSENLYIKDLRVFRNRDLKDIVLIDNAYYSFCFQVNNGIPCIPFYSDKRDQELLYLERYLKKLTKANDVRVMNRKIFRIEEI